MRVSARLLVLLGAVLALEVACGGDPPAPTEVAFVGTLIQQRFASADPFISIPDADVLAVSGSGGVLGQTQTDVNGGFFVGGLPRQVQAELVFSHEPDFVRSVFTGDTESHDSLLFYGAVFEAKRDDANSILAEYATAAGVNTSDLMTFSAASTNTAGAMVRGRVVRLVQTPGGLGYETVKNATVTVKDGTGKSYRVYYRGDFPNNNDPGPVLPNATKTGTDSRFVAFGIDAHGLATLPFPAGPVSVTVTTPDGAFVQSSVVVNDGITEMDFFTVP